VKKEETAQDAEPVKETPAVIAEEMSFGTLRKLAGTIGRAVENEAWEELSSLFWDGLEKRPDAVNIEEAFSDLHAGGVKLADTAALMDTDVRGGYAVFEGENGIYEAVFTADENLHLLSLVFAERRTGSRPESSDTFEEYEITAGNAPRISGMLTMPKEAEEPVVAILLPEEIDDAMDESGSNLTFRKDLAHGLAEKGIASVRFDMRCWEDPLLVPVFGMSFDRTISRDFASIVHTLEQYPVNARKIIYIGHGPAGSLGYSAVAHHYEMDGGLVLLNSPYTEDGVHLLQRAAWLEESAAEEAKEMLEMEKEEQYEIAGFPPSFWQAWQEHGALNYTRRISIPILILQAEADGVVYFKKDYEDWKSQKGSNVTMKSYPDLGHDLINKEEVFEPQICEDIAAWINGEDINKKKTSKTGGKS